MNTEAKQYELQVQVRIQTGGTNGGYPSESLTIAETVLVSAADLIQACKIIGQFYDLAERVKVK